MDKRTYRMPKAVYYQVYWIIKDIERLRMLAAAADSGCKENELVFFEIDEDAVNDREVLKQARYKLDCIGKALETIPEEYRQGTLDSILLGLPFSEMAHENTWRKWRRIFVRNLARALKLI